MQLAGYGQAPASLDAVFAALADPTRRAILARLARGDASVYELAAPFDMSQPAVSKHLKVLEQAGLVRSGQDAQRRPRRLDAQALGEAAAWLMDFREFWEHSFHRLDSVLDEMKSSEKKRTASNKRGKRRSGKGDKR